MCGVERTELKIEWVTSTGMCGDWRGIPFFAQVLANIFEFWLISAMFVSVVTPLTFSFLLRIIKCTVGCKESSV
jgi:hypothetical protein